MRKIPVKLKKRSYDILVCHNEINKLGGLIRRLKIGMDAVIVTNQAIKRLFGDKVKGSLVSAGFNVAFAVAPDTEKAKSEKHCMRLLNRISEFDASHRRVFVIALGGGVIGDLAGFVASIYRRGIPYVQVPTTLLAQVDSAIGGKVAIDLKVGKNLAGAFYQPAMVFSDTSFLKTLPGKELISGLGEVIKYGIIKSPPLFGFLKKNHAGVLKGDRRALQYIVRVCSSIKAGVVEKDEMDNKGVRVILNLGHTAGHAIETAAHYSGRYSHGQAIALGTLVASLISERMGLLDKKYYPEIRGLMKKLKLPVTLKGLDIKDILSAQEHDKKFIHGKNRFVLPVKIGKVVVREGIPGPIIRRSISALFG